MRELYMIVALYAKHGREKDLRRDLIAVVEASRRDAGSLRYEMFEDQADPRRFVFFEHWESAEAQQKHHTETEHIRFFQEHGSANVEKIEIFYKLDRIA